MSKKDWDDIVKEPMSESLKARTLARARQELDGIKESRTRSWAWLIPLLPALGALLLYLRPQGTRKSGDSPQLAEWEFLDEWTTMTDEELGGLDHELLSNLELLEDLDILEEWDGQEKES